MSAGTHQRTMTASEARRGFADIISRVAYADDSVVITRHGRTVAAIVPISYVHRLEAYERAERRREREARGLSLQEIIAQEMQDELDALDG